jgi:hypothetical protein
VSLHKSRDKRLLLVLDLEWNIIPMGTYQRVLGVLAPGYMRHAMEHVLKAMYKPIMQGSDMCFRGCCWQEEDILILGQVR